MTSDKTNTTSKKPEGVVTSLISTMKLNDAVYHLRSGMVSGGYRGRSCPPHPTPQTMEPPSILRRKEEEERKGEEEEKSAPLNPFLDPPLPQMKLSRLLLGRNS